MNEPRPTRRSTWAQLSTEARNQKSRDLDTRAPEEIVDLLLAEDALAVERTRLHRRQIARAAEWFAETYGSGGVILLLGAGTSGRLAILEAAECPPTFNTDPERIRAEIAGGRDAVFAAREGAEDVDSDGRSAVTALGTGDLCLGLSASSVTPYTRGALAQARTQGARTVLITCAQATGLEGLADLVLALDSGPEVLTGSTRLKAGSVTKAVLNAISTTAMVLLGKVFDNLMVDLRVGSAKLQDRQRRILQAAGSAAGPLAAPQIDELLTQSGGELKTAIVMARLGVGAQEARSRLGRAAGSVRRALN